MPGGFWDYTIDDVKKLSDDDPFKIGVEALDVLSQQFPTLWEKLVRQISSPAVLGWAIKLTEGEDQLSALAQRIIEGKLRLAFDYIKGVYIINDSEGHMPTYGANPERF